MKKIVLMIVMAFCFFGCSKFRNPEEDIVLKAETDIKKGMNNPDSYEFVSYEFDAEKTFNEKMKQMPEGNSKNVPDLIYSKLTFRGTNKIGVLVLDAVYVKTVNKSKDAVNEEIAFLGIENIEQ